MKKVTLLALAIIAFSCNVKTEVAKDKETMKKEIIKAEDDFMKLSQSKGIAEAFYTFADSSAVIKREGDSLIQGKENIKIYYSDPKYKNASATWKPDFVDISEDGTMAYTYGKYTWTVKDSTENKKDFHGVFHTVWKRQEDGSWKYVWD